MCSERMSCPVNAPGPNLIALRGETARLFLNERGYQRALQSQELGEIHIISHALVIEGHIIRPKKKRNH